MTIAFDAASNSGYEATLSTYSWTHTTGNISYPGLVVAVAIFASGTVSSITYGGTNLTFIRADANGVYRSELWYLLNPATGANTITVNLSASLTSIAGAASYSKFGGIGAQTGNTGTGNPASATVTPIQNNSIIFSNLAAPTASGTSDAGGQNNRWNNAGALGTQRGSDSGPVTPPASTTLTFNGIGVTDTWAVSAVALMDIIHNPLPVYRV